MSAVLDLRDTTARTSVNLDEAELKENDATKCRQVGESAHYLGLEGILAPSAAGEGTVLAVFFDRLHADSQIRDIDHERWTAPPTHQSS